MKASTIITLAAAIFPPSPVAVALQTKISWDECVDKTYDECVATIQEDHASDPGLFGNAAALEIQKTTPKMSTDHDYYMIGLRTNMAGTHVDGLFGSAGGESMGMVWYPFKWVLPPGTYGDKDYANAIEIDVGPWDCDVGAPLTVEECCSLIKSSVPFADVNGNFLECYANYPVGSVQNPEVSSRVIILTNHQGIVVKAPVAE